MIGPVEMTREDVLQALTMGKSKQQLVESLQVIGKKGEMSALYGNYAGDVAQQVRGSSPEVIAAACEALGYMGQAAEPYAADIALQLEHSNGEVRAAAGNALGMLGSPVAQCIDTLVKIMNEDKDEAAKCAAIGALGQSGMEEQAAPIAGYLKHPSAVVVAAAVQALGELGPAGEAQAGEIAKQLGDARIRYAAICALSTLGDGVCEKYLDDIIDKALTDKDCQTRTVAADIIGRIADAVQKSKGPMPKLVALLKHEDVGVKCAAAMALGSMGDKAADQAVAIKELLADKTEDTSELYLTIGGGSMRAPPSSRRPQCAALVALGMMGAGAQAEAVADCLSDDQWEVKMCALECLAQMGDAGREHSSKVTACLEDDVFVVRTKACECLGALKAEDGLHNVPELFEDKAPAVRQAALLALSEVPDVAQGYSNEVFKLMGDTVVSVQAAAITCLGSMGETGQSYASIIATKLYEEDPGVRAAACEALGKLGDYGAAFAEEVAASLQDGDPEVRMKAVKALGMMGSDGTPFLGDVQFVMNDPYNEVSAAAREVVLALENQ
eukprot:CAMPEP_0197882400 /NCGR_PEP_ID=MMETSP1439-20131203/9563_1 /TAXON_ID=66791 /ORGANISM="Gonyaulax spinifera, Strain CCMP409" /LENGTH=555 /DNA_ID=CAMNT_0043502055 /DNA_START=90 /DNA_END=1757 /DNA_ORIENTATION=-